MKLFIAAILLAACDAQTTEGSGFEPTPTPNGEVEDASQIEERFKMVKNASDCFDTCQSSDACMTEKELQDENNKDLPSRCKECIYWMCGDVLEGNRERLPECAGRARSFCLGCPPMTWQLRRIMGRCKMCIYQCKARKRRVSRFGSRSFCMRRCETPTRCPGKEEMTQQMTKMDGDCKDCVIEQCGRYDQSNKTDVAGCTMQAQSDCDVCPPMKVEERIRTMSCRRCVISCMSFPQPTARPPSAPRRSCRDICTSPVSRRRCPTRDQVIFTIRNRTSAECQVCVNETCESLSGDEMADCIYEARANCSVCPLSYQSMMQRRDCASCIRRCNSGLRVQSVTRPTFHPVYFRPFRYSSRSLFQRYYW
ncbi:unnamed protein product [Clavelina lepadiformis]|uniref:Uncharacterized protein n=1 Tax=Clavelina lepadiformis TaxID=159417 RepID=A0ABP0FIX2_CLALP